MEKEAVAGLAYGWLAGEPRVSAEEHVASCSVCRQRAAKLAASVVDPGFGTRTTIVERPSGSLSVREVGREDELLARGTDVGRYVVDGLLGVGAMGVVYAAYDSKLDRKVALKMLRADHPSGRDRLEQEARAMAPLSHRNLVAVYDIGLHRGRVFVAMEIIEGVTLRSWLAGERHRPREILQAFLQAGRGLAAAHEKGVVHRDVKPDNVLCGHGGRVCVTDFGMAGTPAYMAPEQYLGDALDARSDQYSFCVSLYEALYHQRPFPQTTWAELSDAVIHGRIPEAPPRTEVSAWIHEVLRRGLSVDPEERFGSMTELLDALSVDPRAQRRRLLVAVAAVAVALAAAPMAYQHLRAKSRPVCGQFERKLDGIWDGPKKQSVRDALLATGKPFANDAWSGVERVLDTYASTWVAARTAACEATHVYREQSPDLLDRRIACLDDRSREFAALTDLLARTDEQVAIKSVGAAQSLPSPSSCGNTHLLLARVRPPADGETTAKVEALRGELAKAKALREAGKFREGIAVAEASVRTAETLNYRPALGEALFQLGELRGLTGNAHGAETTLLRAVAIADAEGDDATRARSWARLLADAGYAQSKHHLISLFDEQSTAAISRMGGYPEIDGSRRFYLASAWLGEGKLDDAIREYREALATFERVSGKESSDAIVCRAALADALRGRGRFDEAERMIRDNLAVAEIALGPRHPALADQLDTLGLLFAERLQFAEAVIHVERAVKIVEEAVGANDLRLMAHIGNLGFLRLEQGDYEGAIRYLERAMALHNQQSDWGDIEMVYPLTGIGEAYLELGNRKLAITFLERALLVRDNALAAIALARARFALAKAIWPADRRRARALAGEARDTYRRVGRSPHDERNLRRIEEWLAQPR